MLAAQQQAVNRFALKAGYDVVRWYEDTGFEALGDPCLIRLMERVVSPERDFDLLIVWSFSSLGQNVARLAELLRILSKHGVRLVSATETVVQGSGVDALCALIREGGDVETG